MGMELYKSFEENRVGKRVSKWKSPEKRMCWMCLMDTRSPCDCSAVNTQEWWVGNKVGGETAVTCRRALEAGRGFWLFL